MKRNLDEEYIDNDGRKYAYKFDYIMHSYMLRTFQCYFQEGSVLELGCYKGDFTKQLIKIFKDITVVEGSKELSTIVQAELNTKIQTINCMFEDFYPTRLYDNVFLIHTLEHIDEPIKLLNKIKSWLSPNGKLFLAVPNAEAASRQIAVEMNLISSIESVTDGERRHGHVRTYRLDVLKRHVKQAGLRIVDSGGIMFKPLANFQLDSAIDQKLISHSFLEGCYQLGKRHPSLCSSVFVVCNK